jgi:hypothetical protein
MIARARFPFGRYRNKLLADAPTDYLRWMLTVATSTKLKDDLCIELRRREGRGTPACAAGAGKVFRPRGPRPLALTPFDPAREGEVDW